MEYRVLPGFEPGTSAWSGRGPPEHRTRSVFTDTTSGPHINRLIISSYTASDHVRSRIAQPFLNDLSVRKGFLTSIPNKLLSPSVCVVAQILPCACCTQGKALPFFVGKVNLGSSTVRPSTVPEGSSADE